MESNFIPSETSIAILPGEDTPLPHVPDLAEELRGGTHFTLLYPNTQFACVQDCMWWLTIVPLGPGRCLNRLGFCFPKSSVERPEFDAAVARYYHRWDVSVDEDNATGELQQEGLESALHQPGPYSDRERVVHRFANWVLDRVLD